MSFVIFLAKVYIVILLLRSVCSKQELIFNPLGKILAKVTNPVLPAKNANRFIFLWIFGLVIVTSLLSAISTNMNEFISKFILTFSDYIYFFMVLYVVFMIIGSLGNRPIGGGITSLCFRLGLPWVKLTRMFIPISSGKIVIPAIITVYLLSSFLLLLVNTLFSLFLYKTIGNTLSVYGSILASEAYALFDLLFYMSVIIAVRALISWVSPDPRNMLVQFIYVITEPVLEPLRKLVPPVGFIDFSALIAVLGFYFASIILKGLVSPFM